MIIDGKAISKTIQDELKQKIEKHLPKKPGLAVIFVGDNPASQTYVHMKKKACEYTGIDFFLIKLPSTATQKEVIQHIHQLNNNINIHGILVQLPLPSTINENIIINEVSPQKDVDGFHPLNLGKLILEDDSGFIPCTPLGILTLLEKSSINIEGKHVVIVGRSIIVGKPLSVLLSQKKKGLNATVTLCHSRTKDLSSFTSTADILIAAIGSPHFITEDMVKDKSVVIDVGINRISTDGGNKLVGDVDFDQVSKKTSYITPVPKGVGPMTIASLLQNTYKSFISFEKIEM